MLSATDEANRLKVRLMTAGHDPEVCESIAKEALIKMNSLIDSALQEAYGAAADMGYLNGLEEFVDDLRIFRYGNTYRVWTDSGETNFTDPPYPMLPGLLKNAKTAKDGSKYKVIPMKEKGSTALTTEQAIKEMNAERQRLKELREDKPYMDQTRPANFIEMYSMQKERTKRLKDAKNTNTAGGPVNFKTASSKQDATSKWIHPGKDKDMSPILEDINRSLAVQIDDIIKYVISEYEV